MPATGKTVYVAGAGIAGLTLALALAKFGTHVIVLERQATVSEFGAGLQVSPNARRILDRLGLSDAIAAASLEPEGLDLYPPRTDKPLTTLQFGTVMRERFGAPYTVMHRGDLAQVLHAATRRFANIDIQFNISEWSAEANDTGVTLTMRGEGGTPTISATRPAQACSEAPCRSGSARRPAPSAAWRKRARR